MKKQQQRVTLLFSAIALAGMAIASDANAQCSRETLQTLADTYVQAQKAGNAAVLPLAANVPAAATNFFTGDKFRFLSLMKYGIVQSLQIAGCKVGHEKVSHCK